MNKKILALAIASVVVAPVAAQADVKLSGTIQAEAGSVKVGGGDREFWTTDNTGALTNGGGPNKVVIDVSEKLGNGLSAIGRVAFNFNTSTSSNLGARERWLGLKGDMAHFKLGRIQGTYKTVEVVDPFYATGAQARRMGGGMSGGSAFSHSSFLDNVAELGFKYKGFALTAQGIFDEATEYSTNLSNSGSALASIKYSDKNWGLFGAWSHQNFSVVTDGLGTVEPDGLDNWKAGGWFSYGGLKVALQYEEAEMGAMSGLSVDDMLNGGKGGNYVFGSVAYTWGNVTLATWLAQYTSDTSDAMDAFSYAVGGIYSFSKRTIAYAAYIDSDTDQAADAGDWNAFAIGMRHSF